MKRIIFLLVFFSVIIGVKADNTSLWGFASQIGNFQPQPFNDSKNLTFPDNPEDLIIFDNHLWDFDEDIEDGVSLLFSETTNNRLVIDARESYGRDVLLVVYHIGNVAYFYVSDYNVAMSLRNNSQNSYGGNNSFDNYSASQQGGGSTSSSYYESQYQRWERQAENAYNSLTHASVSASTYTRNKKLLRDAQKEMRAIRRKASAEGIRIPQSQWEDAQVKLE